MKKLIELSKHPFLILLMAIIFSWSARSGDQFNLVGRFDLLSNSSNDKNPNQYGIPANQNGELESTRYDFASAKLNIQKKYNDQLNLFFIWAINNPSWSVQSSGLPEPLQELYVDYQLLDNWKLSMGKLYTLAGGFEGDMNSRDIYLYSLASETIPYYKSGVILSRGSNNQKLSFLVANANDELNQKEQMLGVVWTHSFFENLLQTSISYHFQPIAAQAQSPSIANNGETSPARDNNFFALGTKWNFFKGVLKLDIECLLNQFKKSSENYTKESSDFSLLGRFYYRFAQQFQFLGVLESGVREVAQKTEFERMAYTLGLEYFPFSLSSFRFHVAYWEKTDSYQTHVESSGVEGSRVIGSEISSGQFLTGISFLF